jgi:hypothetical protein
MSHDITPHGDKPIANFTRDNYVQPRKHFITLQPDMVDALMRHEWRCATCGARPTVNIRQDEKKANTFIVFHCHGLDDIHHLQVEAARWRELFRIVPFRPILVTKPKELQREQPQIDHEKALDVDTEVKRLPGS